MCSSDLFKKIKDFFFNDTATTEIYTLSLHDALPISGSPQIYILDIGSERVERLTYEGRYNTSPSWSSRNQIAFASMKGGRFDICTMDAVGGRLRRLTENEGKNEDPCWSPDGRYIMFSSNREGRYHIYIMNANGQNQRRITSKKGEQTAPSWAPE